MAARKAPTAKPATNDRNKALEVALSQIDKQFGKGWATTTARPFR